MVDYNAVHKDKCLTEFLRLKDCYLVISALVPYIDLLLSSYRRQLRSHDEIEGTTKNGGDSNSGRLPTANMKRVRICQRRVSTLKRHEELGLLL